MDKFIKRIQSRLTYSGIKATKAECREALQRGIPEENWSNPSDEQIAEVVEWVIRGRDQIEHDISVDLAPIPQPETFEITAQDYPDVWEHLAAPEETKNAIANQEPEKALAKETASDLSTQPTVSIDQTEVAQAISEAVRRVSEQGNSEAIQLLTTLANELAGDISDTQEMVAALVTSYVNKRQSVLASAIGSLNTIRSAQTAAFQSGLTEDFFDQKRREKTTFLNQIDAMFG